MIPEHTLSLLLQYYVNTPPAVQAFIGWFTTAHGRLATDEGRISIEASPNPGRIYVENSLTDNDFNTFLSVCFRKRPLPLLSIAGGPENFDNFARSVVQHDNEYADTCTYFLIIRNSIVRNGLVVSFSRLVLNRGCKPLPGPITCTEM